MDVLLVERGRHDWPADYALSWNVLGRAAASIGIRALSSDAADAAAAPRNGIAWQILWCMTERCTHVDARTWDYPASLAAMTPGQVFNHVPGMRALTSPDALANISDALAAIEPRARITPETHIVNFNGTSNDARFERAFDAHAPGSRASKPGTWILKKYTRRAATAHSPPPQVRDLTRILLRSDQPHLLPKSGLWLAQRYIANPLLVDGRKFTLRLYVLVASVRPLRVYVHKRGLAVFAATRFAAPRHDHAADLAAHVTSERDAAERDRHRTDAGQETLNTWSVSSLLASLARSGENVGLLRHRLAVLFARLALSAEPTLAEHAAAARMRGGGGSSANTQPPQRRRPRTVELVAADVGVDATLRPWLLSLSESVPNLQAETALLRDTKQAVAADMLSLIGANQRISMLAGAAAANAATRVRSLANSSLAQALADDAGAAHARAELLLREAEEEQVVKGDFAMVWPSEDPVHPDIQKLTERHGTAIGAEDALLLEWTKRRFAV